MKRVFIIVLDSFGIGALPDAEQYGDEGSNTLASCEGTGILRLDNLYRLGLYNIEGVNLKAPCADPMGAYARSAERSKGKDTTTGHWEIAGIISEKPFPTYPNGFPDEVINELMQKTGRGILCNKPYSGTEVIKDYGEQHLETGKLIVYTSADSVLQIAANKSIVPLNQLYDYCKTARVILQGRHAVGRVIARPFAGNSKDDFKRTSGRHDYSLEPTAKTILDTIKESGKEVISVGKINDIFAGKGITSSYPTANNAEGMARTSEIVKNDFEGLCFVNLVDFDMVYGHRNNAVGYANALNEFDSWLGGFLGELGSEDLLIITADHGCDPATPSTDHSREYIPIIAAGGWVKKGVNLGTLTTFADIGATAAEYLGAEICSGESFYQE